MDRCQHCQEQLLDYLYDLLEEPDQSQVEAHLAGCLACQQALHVAQSQQHLLATAARLEGAGVRFEAPPAVELPREPLEQPTVQPLPFRRRSPLRLSQPWLAAAAALLALLGVGVYVHHDHASARQAVARQQDQQHEHRTELANVRIRQGEVEQHRQTAFKRIAEREARDELTVQVTGPHVLAGRNTAPFQIDTTDARGRAVHANVRAELVRADGQPAPALVREMADGQTFRVADAEELKPGDYRLLVHAERPDGSPVTVPIPIQVAEAERITYLTTDRPAYRAGTDIVHYRSLTLDRRTLQPVSDDLELQYVLRLPGGQERLLTQGAARLRAAGASLALLRGPDGQELHGIGTGTLPLTADLPSGEYTLIVRERHGKFAETRTRFLVSRPTNVRLEAGPSWGHPAYRPGEAFELTGHLVRTSGEPVRGTEITARLLADGQEAVPAQRLTTDADGRLHLQSRVPLSATTATVVLTLQDGKTVEEVRAAVPLHLPGVAVSFFAEGGDLIAGLENRVYFQVRDRRGQPLALTGELLADEKPTGIRVATMEVPELGLASGLGWFRFTPQAGVRYRLRVDTADQAGPGLRPGLPGVIDQGVVLTVAESVVEAGQPLRVRAASTTSGPIRVTLSCRGEVLEVRSLPVGGGEAIFATNAARGVCRVTAYEETIQLGHEAPGPVLAAGLAGRVDGPLGVATQLVAGSWQRLELRPRAERLVYCRPAERLEVEVRTDRDEFPSGAKVRLHLQARDEQRRAVPAVMQVGVVDQAALVGADERLMRSLPAQAWLAAELPNPDLLERADALLLPTGASRQALDLVLATRGWRRFEGAGESSDGDRLITVQGRRLPDYPALARERAGLRTTTDEQLLALAGRAEQERAALAEAEADPASAAALARLAWYQENGPRLQQGLILAVAGLLVVVLLVVLARLIRVELERVRPYLALAGGCAVVLIVALIVPPVTPLETESAGQPGNVAQVRPEAAKHPGEQQVEAMPTGGRWSLDQRTREGIDRKRRAMPAPAMAAMSAGGFVGEAKMGQFGADRANLPANADKPANLRAITPPQAAPMMKAMTPASGNASLQKGETATDRFRRELAEELQQAESERLASRAQEKAVDAGPRALVVRTFANVSRKRLAGEQDQVPLIYWHPVLVLPGEGVTVEFQLGAQPTRYRIDVQAHGLDGRLGSVRKEFSAVSEK